MSEPVRRAGRAPGTVTMARVLLAAVSLYHLAIVLFTVTHTELLRQNIAVDHSGFASSAVEENAGSATVLALAVHIPLFVLTGYLAVALASGHPWSLRPATVSQLFGIAFISLSTPPFDDLRALIPLLIVLQASVIAFLWIPRRSRTFFANHPRSRRSLRQAQIASEEEVRG